MRRHVTTPEAYRFWLRLADNLAQVEGRGVRIDKGYLDGAITQVTADIRALEAALQAEPDFRVWRRRFGERTRLGAYDQVAAVVYGDLGFKSELVTEKKGRAAATAANLEAVAAACPMVRHFLEAAKLRKALDTYLVGIRREMVQHADGLWYVHPSYNLNSVLTFRSSCERPNYQNQPKRNPRIAEIVRRCYVPRPGRQLGEDDYGQIEVRVPVPITGDATLRAYVCDPTKDMHYDMACQLFRLERPQVSKALRNIVKGAYVFATFYGSYYGLTAKDLWEDVDNLDGKPVRLEGSDVTVRQHLAALGIAELGDPDDPRPGTWAAHVRAVDEDFWGRRFRRYADWKREWYAAYLAEGGFTFPTGFAVRAPGLDKKQVCNAPIQGSGFHLLGWALCEINERLVKRRMRSMVIGEIHDCINFDLHPAERDDVFDLAQRVMVERIREFAPWLDVPLVAEPEAAPVDASWHDLRALKAAPDGRFVPSDMGKWEAAFGPWANQRPTESQGAA